MSILPAERLSLFSEYYFSSKLRSIKALKDQGRPIINLGIGSPDQDPDLVVLAKLVETSRMSGIHGYQPYQGIPELTHAIRQFYSRKFEVNWSDASVLPLMGSKEGITHISLAYLNPGDQVLIPALGYPTYTSVARMVGAAPVYFPLLESNNWEPDWRFLENLDCSKVKIMWLNYPHMPTGTKATDDLLRQYVEFAKSRNMLIGYDNPYSFILNDKPRSIFNISGAEDVAIELNSLSKTFNMAGWRVGWAMGSETLIKPVLQIKSNMDSGMFMPLQAAAVEALGLDDSWYQSLNQTYDSRRNVAYKILDKLGCTYVRNQAGMFVWAKVPSGNGVELADKLLDEFDTFVAPGFIFGEAGQEYIRISLCVSEEKLEEVDYRITKKYSL